MCVVASSAAVIFKIVSAPTTADSIYTSSMQSEVPITPAPPPSSPPRVVRKMVAPGEISEKTRTVARNFAEAAITAVLNRPKPQLTTTISGRVTPGVKSGPGNEGSPNRRNRKPAPTWADVSMDDSLAASSVPCPYHMSVTEASPNSKSIVSPRRAATMTDVSRMEQFANTSVEFGERASLSVSSGTFQDPKHTSASPRGLRLSTKQSPLVQQFAGFSHSQSSPLASSGRMNSSAPFADFGGAHGTNTPLNGRGARSDSPAEPLSRVHSMAIGDRCMSMASQIRSPRWGLGLELNLSRIHSLGPSRRSSLAMAECTLTPIVDNILHLGSHRDVSDITLIRTFNIRAFLCVAAEVTAPLPCFVTDDDLTSGAVAFKHVLLKDGPSTRLADHVAEVFQFIDEQAAAGRPVALFCQQGKSRSASFVVAYLMREYGVDSAEALELLHYVYPKAEPNFFFLSQLRDIAPFLPPIPALRLPKSPYAGSSALATVPTVTDYDPPSPELPSRPLDAPPGMSPLGRGPRQPMSPDTASASTPSEVCFTEHGTPHALAPLTPLLVASHPTVPPTPNFPIPDTARTQRPHAEDEPPPVLLLPSYMQASDEIAEICSEPSTPRTQMAKSRSIEFTDAMLSRM
jgi:hypothetical protein